MENTNTNSMTALLKVEEAAQLAICIAALYFQSIHITWWLWPFLFLSPDLSMLGYLFNTKWGAMFYNLFHHKATAGLLIGTGSFLQLPLLLFVGLILWAHSSFDRMLGYGLKYEGSFQHTHLGFIGKKEITA